MTIQEILHWWIRYRINEAQSFKAISQRLINFLTIGCPIDCSKIKQTMEN